MATYISILESGLKVVLPEQLSGDGGQILTDNFQLLDAHIMGTGYQHYVSINDITEGTGTLTSNDRGQFYGNNSATGVVGYNLPTAASGLEFKFVVSDTDGVHVNATSTSTIRVNTDISTTDGSAVSSGVGASLTLLALNSSSWVATAYTGTWTLS